MSMHLRELKMNAMNWPIQIPLFQLTAVSRAVQLMIHRMSVYPVDFVKALPAGVYAPTQAGDISSYVPCYWLLLPHHTI